MKASGKKLGLEIQLFLLKRGLQIDDLARQMGMTADGLSNLIHGRRRFKDETLLRLAETPALKEGGFSLQRLKALRAVDEYSFEELLLALVEDVKHGAVEQLPDDFFLRFQEALEQAGLPPRLADKKHALLALVQEAQQ